jgi:DNA-directed RNA polymerase II subunit RPB1
LISGGGTVCLGSTLPNVSIALDGYGPWTFTYSNGTSSTTVNSTLTNPYILNQAAAEAGKIGLKSLSKDNRFVIMVNAGSKGSELNISQMISCLGPQSIEGKRAPYGFDNRTLPHFSKYDGV